MAFKCVVFISILVLCLMAAAHATSIRPQPALRGGQTATPSSDATATRTPPHSAKTRRSRTRKSVAGSAASPARRSSTPQQARIRHGVTSKTAAAPRLTNVALRRRVRRVKWNPLFPGTHEMLVRQNQQLTELELPRIANDEELIALEQARELVPVADSASLNVASNLLENRRYCRPWTRDFLQDFSEAFYREFDRPIVATSLVRTAEQQKKLRRRIRNAGPPDGETASTHLTGVTVDILKRGMSQREHAWVEHYMMPLKKAGLIDPIEERRQPVFHVVVFDSYSDVLHPSTDVPEPQLGPLPMRIPTFDDRVPAVTSTLSEAPAGVSSAGNN